MLGRGSDVDRCGVVDLRQTNTGLETTPRFHIQLVRITGGGRDRHLMVQGVAHWLLGRSPDRHRPHRRRADHRGGGARRWNPLGQIPSFVAPPLRGSFRKTHLFDDGHQWTVLDQKQRVRVYLTWGGGAEINLKTNGSVFLYLHVCGESRRDDDWSETHAVLPDAVRLHLGETKQMFKTQKQPDGTGSVL